MMLRGMHSNTLVRHYLLWSNLVALNGFCCPQMQLTSYVVSHVKIHYSDILLLGLLWDSLGRALVSCLARCPVSEVCLHILGTVGTALIREVSPVLRCLYGCFHCMGVVGGCCLPRNILCWSAHENPPMMRTHMIALC